MFVSGTTGGKKKNRKMMARRFKSIVLEIDVIKK